MAVQTTGTVGLAPEMKVYYDRRLLTRALPNLLHAQFAQRRGIPKRGGKTIEFRKFATLGVNTTALTEGTPPAGQALSVSAITASVLQYGDFVSFSDLVATTTIDPLLEETTDLLAEEAAETIDTLIRDVLVTGTNVQYVDAALATNTLRTQLAAGDIMKMVDIRLAVLTLKRNRAKPINGAYQAIIHPDVFFDIQGTTEWVTANTGGERTGRIQDGSLGMLYGVKFWETDKAKVFTAGSGDSKDVYASIFLGANAYGIVDLAGHNLQTIFKPLGSAGTADPLNQQGSMGWKITFTTRILDDANVLRVESVASPTD